MPEITIKEIKKVIDDGFEKQAVLINNAFQAHTEHFDDKLDKLGSRMDGKLEQLEDRLSTDIKRVEAKVDQALHVEYINLEVRVKRIENKIGLEPIKESK